MKKELGLTLIKKGDVIEEETMSMILGGNGGAYNNQQQRFCLVHCKALTICKPNRTTEPSDTIGTDTTTIRK